MIDRIGQGSSLARAAIEAALKNQTEALRRMSDAVGGKEDQGVQASGFAKTLADGVRSIDSEVRGSDTLALDVVSGKVSDFHEVAAQLKQSELSLKFALEVRNKFIDAYREIMRMSV